MSCSLVFNSIFLWGEHLSRADIGRIGTTASKSVGASDGLQIVLNSPKVLLLVDLQAIAPELTDGRLTATRAAEVVVALRKREGGVVVVADLVDVRLPDIDAKVAGESVRVRCDTGVVASVVAAGLEAGGSILGPLDGAVGGLAAALLVDVLRRGDGEAHAVALGGDADVGGAEGFKLEVKGVGCGGQGGGDGKGAAEHGCCLVVDV